MSHPGLGVMLHHLFGRCADPAPYFGRKITAAALTKGGDDVDRLVLTFEGGDGLALFDDGQSCCESRYMTTDDDVSSLVGQRLARIDAKDGPETSGGDYFDEHEQVFVEVGTDQGFVTLVTHNEHNGFYGGFALTLEAVPKA